MNSNDVKFPCLIRRDGLYLQHINGIFPSSRILSTEQDKRIYIHCVEVTLMKNLFSKHIEYEVENHEESIVIRYFLKNFKSASFIEGIINGTL